MIRPPTFAIAVVRVSARFNIPNVAGIDDRQTNDRRLTVLTKHYCFFTRRQVVLEFIHLDPETPVVDMGIPGQVINFGQNRRISPEWEQKQAHGDTFRSVGVIFQSDKIAIWLMTEIGKANALTVGQSKLPELHFGC